MIKRILFVVGVLFVVTIIAAIVFFITFDANHYIPLVEERLQEVVKHPVTIERLGFGWHGGVSIDMHGLRILEGEAPSPGAEEPESPESSASPAAADATDDVPPGVPETAQAYREPQSSPILDVDRVSAVLRLGPLLRKEVQIDSVEVLRPRARIFRDAQGRLNLIGAAAPIAPAAAPAQAEAQDSPVAFQVDRVAIEDGLVQWTDRMAQPPMAITVDQLDVVLSDVTAVGLAFQVKAAVFSNEQNLSLQGRCALPGEGRTGALEQVRAEINLAEIQPSALQQALPTLDIAALRQGLAGRLVASAERVPFDPKQIQEATAQVSLEGGRVALPNLASPINGLALEATVQADRLHIAKCEGNVAGGKFAVRGVVSPLTDQPRADITLNAEKISLTGLLPTPSADTPHLRGIASVAFTGSARGTAWPQIAQSLAGSGRIQLQDGALANVNVVRMVFEQLAVLPAVVDRLQAKMPPQHRDRLNQRDTILHPIDQPINVANGTAVLPDMHLETDLAALDGTLTLSLLQPTVSGQLMLAVEPELSAAIFDSIKELQALADAQARLSMPVIVQAPGRPPVIPDIQYVASRVIATKAQDFLGDVLNRYLAPQSTEQPAGQPTPAPSS